MFKLYMEYCICTSFNCLDDRKPSVSVWFGVDAAAGIYRMEVYTYGRFPSN